EHGRVVGDDSEVIKAAGSTEDGFLFDALDDPETMVRVNDLVADFKCHESPCWKRGMGRPKSCRQSYKYRRPCSAIQRKMAGKWPILPVRRSLWTPRARGVSTNRTRGCVT